MNIWVKRQKNVQVYGEEIRCGPYEPWKVTHPWFPEASWGCAGWWIAPELWSLMAFFAVQCDLFSSTNTEMYWQLNTCLLSGNSNKMTVIFGQICWSSSASLKWVSFFYFTDMMMGFWKLLVFMVLSTVPRSRWNWQILFAWGRHTQWG